MNPDYSKEKEHYCPWCETKSDTLERFKEHLTRCRKGSEKEAYICKYYFGHLFRTREDTHVHEEKCIFKDSPVRYPEHKKMIILGKNQKHIIERENFPAEIPQNFVVKEQILTNKIMEEKMNKGNIFQQNKIDRMVPEISHSLLDGRGGFIFYTLEDPKFLTSQMHLSFSRGASFSVNTFTIQEYEPIDRFDQYFAPQRFTKEDFEKYGTMFTLWDPIEGKKALKVLKQMMGNENIGINRSKEDTFNEVLIIILPETRILGKYLATDVGLLVVPASQLDDNPRLANHGRSFYRGNKINDIAEMLNPNYGRIEEEVQPFVSKFLQSLGQGTDFTNNIRELEESEASLDELRELLEKIEKMKLDEERGLNNCRQYSYKEITKLKNEIDKEKDEVSQLMTAIRKKENEGRENDIELEKAKIESKMRATLQKAKIKSNSTYESAMQAKEQELQEKNKKIVQLKEEIDEAEKEKAALREERKKNLDSLKPLEREIEKQKKTLEEMTIMQRKLFESKGVSGSVTLEDFRCEKCKVRLRKMVYFPCRHMLYCEECGRSAKSQWNSKCDKCKQPIEEWEIVKYVEYRISDELLKSLEN